MKIVQETIQTGTFEEFADAHGLQMKVVERRLPVGDPCRFYARLDGVEEKQGNCLVGIYGNGPTPEEAIRDYAKQISMKLIVHNAMSDDRRECLVWRLTEGEA